MTSSKSGTPPLSLFAGDSLGDLEPNPLEFAIPFYEVSEHVVTALLARIRVYGLSRAVSEMGRR
jgi:hypothetical protein